MTDVSDEKLNNDVKYRRSAHSILSSQTLMYKVEEYLPQTVADPPPMDQLKVKLGKIAVLTNSAATNLTTNLHDAIEKAVLG